MDKHRSIKVHFTIKVHTFVPFKVRTFVPFKVHIFVPFKTMPTLDSHVLPLIIIHPLATTGLFCGECRARSDCTYVQSDLA